MQSRRMEETYMKSFEESLRMVLVNICRTDKDVPEDYRTTMTHISPDGIVLAPRNIN